MDKLYVLYDASCGLCSSVRDWAQQQPQLIPIVFVAANSRQASALFPSLSRPGARPEEWQTRSLADGSTHTVYKRHFDIDVLLAEVGGEPLFAGRYFVLVRSVA